MSSIKSGKEKEWLTIYRRVLERLTAYFSSEAIVAQVNELTHSKYWEK